MSLKRKKKQLVAAALATLLAVSAAVPAAAAGTPTVSAQETGTSTDDTTKSGTEENGNNDTGNDSGTEATFSVEGVWLHSTGDHAVTQAMWNTSYKSSSNIAYVHKLADGIFGNTSNATATTKGDTTTITIAKNAKTTVSKLESTFLGDGCGRGWLSYAVVLPANTTATQFSMNGSGTKNPLFDMPEAKKETSSLTTTENSDTSTQKFEIINVPIWDAGNGFVNHDLTLTFYDKEGKEVGTHTITVNTENAGLEDNQTTGYNLAVAENSGLLDGLTAELKTTSSYLPTSLNVSTAKDSPVAEDALTDDNTMVNLTVTTPKIITKIVVDGKNYTVDAKTDSQTITVPISVKDLLTSTEEDGKKKDVTMEFYGKNDQKDELLWKHTIQVDASGAEVTATEYTISFNVGDDTGVTAPASQTTTGKKLAKLPELTREGYTLEGWYTDTAFTSKVTTDTVFTQDTILYAKWTEGTSQPETGVYTITFDANGGSVTPVSGKTANGKLASLPTPTRSGYNFKGWYTATTGGSVVTANTTFDADGTIYAQWSKKTSSGGSNRPSRPSNGATSNSDNSNAFTLSGSSTNSATGKPTISGSVGSALSLVAKGINLNPANFKVVVENPNIVTVGTPVATEGGVSLPLTSRASGRTNIYAHYYRILPNGLTQLSVQVMEVTIQ